MPWPTDPASEFFGRGLWGWATSVWERITSNGSGSLNVHIKSQTGTQLIQQTMPTLLKPGIHGYDGATWRPLSLLWGFSGIMAETKSWTSDGTTPYNLDGSVCPAGEVWIANSARMMHNNAGALSCWLYCMNAGNAPLIDGSQTTAFNAPIGNVQPCIIAAGGFMRGIVYGLPAAQVVYLHIQGYRMTVG